jgi:hypothetical protein
VKPHRTALAIAAALVALVLPELAAACPMCMAGQGGGTQKAFAIGSLFLSITPLVAIGAVVWYLRRRARAIEAERAAAPEAPPAGQTVSLR